MKHSMSKRAGYCPEVDRGLTWIVTGQPSVDFIALNQIGNGCDSVQRVPMIHILVVGSLRNGRAGCSGPDRNGSRAAEPNEFDAGNVRSPDRGTRGGERRVEDPGGGSGSATADQLTELLETTVHGRTRTARDPDVVIRHEPTCCRGCGSDLTGAAEVNCSRRQVFDIPPIKVHVTEHQIISRRCPCAKTTTGPTPAKPPHPCSTGR